VKWEVVKNHVGREVHSKIQEGRDWETMATILVDFVIAGTHPPEAIVSSRASFKLYADKAWDTIQQWDIRAVGRLRDLFPGEFPKSLAKGDLVAFYDDKGDWAVCRKEAA
jgi:hypothetical protein